MTKIFESFAEISESKKLFNINFNSHKKHNPYCDIVTAQVDNDTMITYGIYIKNSDLFRRGDEFMELYVGENYVPDSRKRSHSRRFGVSEIPAKYKAAWEELKELYETKYINEALRFGLRHMGFVDLEDVKSDIYPKYYKEAKKRGLSRVAYKSDFDSEKHFENFKKALKNEKIDFIEFEREDYEDGIITESFTEVNERLKTSDPVSEVVEIIKSVGSKETLDFRITYSHKGVKVNISYLGGTYPQKKQFPNIKEALIDALEKSIESIKCIQKDASFFKHEESIKYPYLEKFEDALEFVKTRF